MESTLNELKARFLEESGDIFSLDADMLLNPVNCKGVSGKGLALAFKEKFPVCQSRYETICKQTMFIEDPTGIKRKVPVFKPGDLLHFIEISKDNLPLNLGDLTPEEIDELLLKRQHVVFFPTKNHWKNPSKYEYIESGLKSLSKLLQKEGLEGVNKIAIPALGCGLGGLDWTVVKSLIYKELGGLEKTFILIPPK